MSGPGPIGAVLPEPPVALIEALEGGDCVLYSGSGLSSQAGLPTWRETLEQLLAQQVDQSLVASEAASGLVSAITAGNYRLAADELSLGMPDRELEEHAADLLRGARPSRAHDLIARLPFAAALTSNFDELLEVACRCPNATYVPSDSEAVLRDLRERRFFVLHLNGHPSRSGSLRLSPQPDDHAASLQLREALQLLFARYSILFIGASLVGIRAFLDGLEVRSLRSERGHFAFVSASEDDTKAMEARFLSRNYGVTTIWFRASEGYPEVPAFLGAVEQRLTRTRARPHPVERPSVRRVVLENIGPFDGLDLVLAPGWNILLGDNGMGKSIVLRAVAATLCGDEARAPSVPRLLKSGRTRGRIEVHIGQRVFAMELQRDSAGLARVTATMLSPLKLGEWLVLGFPALRGITWERPAGPGPAVPTAPSAADVLPILTDRPDTRLDNLKQWIINLDYQSSGQGGEATTARRILNRFFEVLDGITPGVKLALHAIDRRTQEITLLTDGGLVPLESLSQGTVSVLCWVGVLLRRLHEAHSALDQPEHGGALVLVDEIDAHMHPAWQQSLAPALRDLFPEVQVLATTHSPLIVTSMRPEEIFLVRRGIDGAVRVEQPGIDIRGYRADQILTSPLFSLESTRDPTIHAKLLRYTELSARGDLSHAEQQELAATADFLKLRLPSPAEREETRQARALLEDALNERLAKMAPERKAKLAAELSLELQELVSGSRRPR